MPDKKKIQSQLEAYTAFQMATNKKEIVNALSQYLKSNEDLSLLQEGFFKGLRLTEASSGVFGFLFLSTERLFFMSNNQKQAQHFEEINGDSIKKVSVKKNFASITISMDNGSEDIQFRSVIPHTEGLMLASKIQEYCSLNTPLAEDVSEHDNYRIFDKPVNNDMLGDFVNKISSVSQDIVSHLSSPKVSNNTHHKFLFEEAKKIYSLLEEYFTAPTLKEMIVKDMIILSSMCTIADHEINEQETFFLSLIFLALEKGKSVAKKDVEDLFSHKQLSDEYKELVLQHQNSVIKKVESITHRADAYPFQALSYLKGYDDREGTLHFSRLATLYNTYAECIVKADGTVTKAEEEILKNINQIIHTAPLEEQDPAPASEKELKTEKKDVKISEDGEEPETLEDVMKDLNQLIGMDNIKEQINTFINLIKVQKAREKSGLPLNPTSLHAVFYGPPGTGKTTTARLLGRIYKCLGLLSQGHIVETDRVGLVAGYVGQTAIKTDEMIQKSLDGILFIDEAYALAPADSGKDFGQEAIDTILKRMEDYRERLVIIVAGYPDEMKTFINTNPGLKSRFSRYFNFDHYEPQQLLDILQIFTKKSKFTLSKGAKDKLLALFTEYYESRDKSFGNGRLARNLFEKTIERQANRIASISPLTDKVLCSIKAADIPEKDEMVL